MWKLIRVLGGESGKRLVRLTEKARMSAHMLVDIRKKAQRVGGEAKATAGEGG